MERRWTSSELSSLRSDYARLDLTSLARQLGRSRNAVKCRAQKLGLSRGVRRFWQPQEDKMLRELWPITTAGEIARRLGRGVASVYCRLDKLGLMQPKPGWSTNPQLHADIRASLQRGESDADVARRWVIDRRHVGDIRNALRLPPSGDSPLRRARVASKTREQLRRAGLRSMGELRLQSFRDFARRNGWPEDLRPRAVQMLNVLYQRGPMTRRQIAEALRMPWKGANKSLCSNDPEGSYLANLMKRGLVLVLRRAVRGRGKGRSTSLYFVAPYIQRSWPE